MSIEKHNEGVETQKLALMLYSVTIIILFIFLIVSIVVFFISFSLLYKNISLLNKQYFGTIAFSLLLPSFLLFVAVLIHTSPILSSKVRKNKESSIDYFEMLKELQKPIHRKNKTRKIIFWILITLSILSLIGSQIYLYIGVFVLLN